MTQDPKAYFSLPKGDPYFTAIGMVASCWAKLERTADHAIWEFMQADPPVTACVTAQLIGFIPRIRTIIALHEQLGGDVKDRKKMRRLQNDSQKIQQERNRVVHDPWYYSPVTGIRARYAATTSSSGKPILEFIPVSIDELHALADRISTYEVRAWRTFEDVAKPFRESRRGWFSVGRLE